MNTVRSPVIALLGVVSAFVAGLLVVDVGPKLWEAQIWPALVRVGLASPGEPKIPECNAKDRVCAQRFAAEAERFERIGRPEEAEAIHRRAAFDGDARSAFMAGWLHEEAYRAAVGERMRSFSPLPELDSTGAEDLPRGPGFAMLVEKAEREAATASERHRRLAYLFYLRAAIDGFAPAMNNLGSMFQFGLTGVNERANTDLWYERAAAAGNPVAVLNLIRMRVRDLRAGTVSCSMVRVNGPFVVVKTRDAPTPDRDDAILDRTRFRGRVLPAEMRTIALEGPSYRLRKLLVTSGVTIPAISQSELLALTRDQPDGWAFDADPDEAEVDLPRFRRDADYRQMATNCRTQISGRSHQSDAERMQQLRSIQDTYDQPTRRSYSRRWW